MGSPILKIIEINIPEPRVLILDDDPFFAATAREYLQSLGAQVTVASTVAQAQDLLDEEEYQVIVADMMFENSTMQGDQFILNNAEQLKNTHVLAVTGAAVNFRLREPLRERGVKLIEKGDPNFGAVLERSLKESVRAYAEKVKTAAEEMLRSRAEAPTAKATEGRLTTRRLQVFLCHSSTDRSGVRALHDRLVADGMDPWLDEEALLPGQEWELEIKKAVRYSDIVIICLSEEAVNKTGYVQNEIRIALEVANQKPEGEIFIIPLRLEACEIPDRLSRWQRVVV